MQITGLVSGSHSPPIRTLGKLEENWMNYERAKQKDRCPFKPTLLRWKICTCSFFIYRNLSMNDAAVWEEPCTAALFSKSGCGERILHRCLREKNAHSGRWVYRSVACKGELKGQGDWLTLNQCWENKQKNRSKAGIANSCCPMYFFCLYLQMEACVYGLLKMLANSLNLHKTANVCI